MSSSTVTMATTVKKVKDIPDTQREKDVAGNTKAPESMNVTPRATRTTTLECKARATAAGKFKSPSPSPARSDSSVDLRETVARLHGELERVRRGHQVELERQRAEASVTAKNMRSKLLADNKRELDLQREALQRKHEQDLGKQQKQRESEVGKLRADLNKCQQQLAQYTGSSGLSAQQRHAFDAERSKLTAEMQDLRGQKRRLEDLVRTAQAAQKQMAKELRQISDTHAADVARIRREADFEVKKLLEELKSNKKTISTLEKDTGLVKAEATIAKQQEIILNMATEIAGFENEKREAAMSESTDSAMSLGESSISSMSSSSATEQVLSLSSSSGTTALDSAVSIGQPPDPGKSPPPLTFQSSVENQSTGMEEEPHDAAYVAMTELRVKLRKTEDAVTNLTQDKADLMKRFKDMEKKFKQAQEKSRKFLEKNMEITNINRNLEEKAKKLNEDNSKLKATAEKNKREMARMANRINHEKQGKIFVDGLTEEIDSLREQIDDAGKTIDSLKLSCEEKDRRIELLAHRRKKQRATKQQQKVVRFNLPSDRHKSSPAAGIKETYYGYDEDSRSVDSEPNSTSMSSSRGVSVSSHVSLDNSEDDVLDEFTREEFGKNYQRLAKEHLELEKSFALLQAHHGSSHVDPQREGKLRSQLEDDLLDAQTKIEDLEKLVQDKGKELKEKDTSWLEEKEKLNKAIRKLKEKISAEEEAKVKLKTSVKELNEQNEVLEFRLLELEDCTEKLVEEVGEAVKRKTGRTEGGEENTNHDIYVPTDEDIQQLRESLDGPVPPSERALFLKVGQTLDYTQKKLQQITEERDALLEQQAQQRRLDDGANDTDDSDRVSTELVLEYEAVRNELIETKEKINSLTKELQEEKQRAALLQLSQIRANQKKKPQRNGHNYHESPDELHEKIESLTKELVEEKQRSAIQHFKQIRASETQKKQEPLNELETKIESLTNELAVEKQRSGILYLKLLGPKHHTQNNDQSDEPSDTFKNQIKTLTDELATEKQKAAVLEYKLVRADNAEHKLQDSAVTQSEEIDGLRRELAEEKQKSSVLQYKQLRSDHAETRYRGEITKLKRRISTTSEGRQHESELWEEKIDQLKQAEKTIQELRTERDALKDSIKEKQQQTLQDKKKKLQKQPELTETETEALVESIKEKDTMDNNNSPSSDHERTNRKLAEEVADLRARLEEAERNEGELTEHTLGMQDDLDALQKRCAILQQELDFTEEELDEAHRKCGHLEQEVELSQQKCTSAERELQLACLAMEKLKTGAADVDFDSAEVLQRSTEEKAVLQSEVKDLRAAIEKKDKHIDLLTKTNEAYQNDEEDLSYLKEHIEMREAEIEQLHLKIHKLEQSEVDVSEKVLELSEIKDELEKKLQEADDREKKGGEEKQRLQAQVDELKVNNNDLHGNLTRLSANQSPSNDPELANQIAAYKERIESLEYEVTSLKEVLAAEKEKRNDKKEEAQLRQTIQELEEDLEEAKVRFDKAHDEFDSHDADLQKKICMLETQLVELQEEAEKNDSTLNITLYEEKIEELEKDLVKAHEAEKKFRRAEEEHDHRIEELELRIKSMEENEQKLGDTIEDLKEIESSLKGKVVETEMDITEKEKLVQERDELKLRVQELEQKLKDGISTGSDSEVLKRYEVKMKELVERVEELTVRESELMKEAYEQKMENHELQEHLEEVLDEKLESDSLKQLEELKLRLKEIEQENKELKEVVVKEKLHSIEEETQVQKELLDRIAELEKNEGELKEHIKKANSEIETLNVQLKESGTKTKVLLDKMEVLEFSEQKLMEQLDQAEERNEKLAENLGKAQIVGDTNDQESEKREQKLREEIDKLKEEMNRGMVDSEVLQLRNKVEVLVEAEGKLVDRLQEQEEVEEELRQTIANLESQVKASKTTSSKDSDYKGKALKLREDVKRLEKVEIEQLAKISSLQGSLSEFEKSNKELNQTVTELKQADSMQKLHISNLESAESKLKTQIKEIETEKQNLASSLQSEKSALSPGSQVIKTSTPRELNSKPPALSQLGVSPRNALGLDVSFASTTGAGAAATDREGDVSFSSALSSSSLKYTPLAPEQIQSMSREELQSGVQELQAMELYHRQKIAHLTDNLDELRNAVEVVAVTMETDAGIPVVKYRPKVKDSEFEARLQELVKSESALKIRVMELEKKEVALKRELGEAESVLKEQEQDYKHELDELEDELNETRKNEAKLKNKLQYGGMNAQNETAALAKIQHLEELVCDLETAETKLKRQLQDANRDVHDLEEKLKAVETESKESSKSKLSLAEKENQFLQEQKVKELTIKNAELQEELDVLKKDDNLEKLSRRVSELQRTEKALRLKLDLLEEDAHQNSDQLTSTSLLDSPEDLLRHRVRELERLERHQRHQVAELERDRDELHSLARADKDTMHELSVRLRELQIKEKSLREQLSRCEQSESLLQLRCDELGERLEETEDQLKQARTSERSMRAQLTTFQQTHSDLSRKLENSQEDLQSAESKLRKKIEDLQRDKRELREKCDEFTDRIGDLEGAELTYKQKLRHVENKEQQLRGRLAELETRESNSEQRRIELEQLNDALSDKVHALEEEKAGLLYSISDFEIGREESAGDVAALKSKMAVAERKITESERRRRELEARLDEFTAKEVAMQTKLGDTEKTAREMQQTLEAKVKDEGKLRQKLNDLEKEYVAVDDKVKSADSLEKQLSFVRNQLEYHQRAHEQADKENQRVKERLTRYEKATDDRSLVQIPASELREFQNQEKLLDELEKSVHRLESSEKSLQNAVEKLREGKEACGHEFELEELNARIKESQMLAQAHELLKENHEETKQELARAKANKQRAGKNVQSMSTKSIQAHLSETINLTGLKPEFKSALKSLGTRHPQAYEEFVRHLQPTSSASSRDYHPAQRHNTSHVRVSHDETDMGRSKHHPKRVEEDVIEPKQRQQQRGAGDDGTENNELDNNQSMPKKEKPTAEERKALIGQLATAMAGTERPLWQEVEGRKSSAPGEDDDYWEQLEKNMGDTDDMMLTINFGSEDDSRPSSSLSLPPPPLPGSQPPHRLRSPSPGADSYYLPSADEASELEEDTRAGSLPPRARSLEPDSGAYTEPRGLPTLGMGSVPKRGRGGKRVVSASLDSIPDDSGFQDVDAKMLREKVALLQEQVKVKEDEVKVMRSDNEELAKVKATLRDRENELAKEKLAHTEQSDKLSRTLQELNQVKAERDDVKAKILAHEIPVNTVNLESRGQDEAGHTDMAVLQTQLERKERELNAKNNEVDRLSKEMRQWQENCRSARDDHTAADTERRQLANRIQALQTDSNRLAQVEDDYRNLLTEHDRLKEQLQSIESSGDEKAALEKIVLKLRGQLSDLERIDLERSDFETKVKALENELREKTKQETSLASSNVQLKHQLDELQQQNGDYAQIEAEYNKVRSKFSEMEQLKTKAQLAITPLRAKVLRLAQKCKAKDEVIEELVSALHSGSSAPDSLAKADNILIASASDEYQRPISPVTAKALEDFQECSDSLPPSPILEVRSTATTATRPPATLHQRTQPQRPHAPTRRPNSLETTSESDELDDSNVDLLTPTNDPTFLSLAPVSQLANGGGSPNRLQNGHHGAKYHNGSAVVGPVVMPEMFQVVKDYQPEHFSRSGHQRLELTLKEGDIVKVLGPQDDRGYFEAQVGGRVGLVPVSYCMPLPTPPSRPAGKKTRRPHTIGVDSTPEQILDMHQQLQRSHTPNHHVPAPSIVHPAFARALSPRQPARPSSSPSPRHNGTVHKPLTGAPHSPTAAPVSVSAPVRVVPPMSPPLAPPTDLRIQRTVGDHSLLLSWSLPSIDELGRNNGVPVRGYKIYIDSKDRQSVPSPHMTKALVEHLDLRRPHSFSIQTVGGGDGGGAGSKVSALSDTVMFEDVMEDNGTEDGMSITSSSVPTDSGSDRKVHVALYDYVPSPSVPHMHQHLPFNAGDIVVTYGAARPDGLYNGKVQGKKGLVPASFIEEVAILKSKGRRSLSAASSATSVQFSLSSATNPHTTSRHSITSSASSSQQHRHKAHRV